MTDDYAIEDFKSDVTVIIAVPTGPSALMDLLPPGAQRFDRAGRTYLWFLLHRDAAAKVQKDLAMLGDFAEVRIFEWPREAQRWVAADAAERAMREGVRS